MNSILAARPVRHPRSIITRASAENPPQQRSFLSVLCPLLRAFSSGDLKSGRPRWWEVSTSGLASLSRLSYGSETNPISQSRNEPSRPIRIYEFEACPFCRRVREAVTDLDLTVEVYPCPKDARKTRSEVEGLGGKQQFPFLVDENKDKQLYESQEIVEYLYESYGLKAKPPAGMLESTALTGWMPTVFRIGRGMVRYPNSKETPLELLELFNYENNQFSRLVREVLCELELPYRCVSCGKGSKNRERLQSLQGSTQVPFLVDPNTGTKMGDSEKIIEYLLATYTTD